MQVDPYCENMDSDTLFVVFPLCTNTVNIKSIRLKCRLSSLSQRVKNISLILGAVPQKISNGTRDKKSHLIKWGGAKKKKKKKIKTNKTHFKETFLFDYTLYDGLGRK